MPSPKTRVAGTLHAPSAMGLRVGAGDSLFKAVEQLGEGKQSEANKRPPENTINTSIHNR